MPKQRLSKLAQEYDIPFEEALRIVQESFPSEFLTGKGKLTWVSEEGQDIIHDNLFIAEIIPPTFLGEVLSECPNARFNYVYSKEVGKRVPVMIPRKLRGKLVGKIICFEGIKDDTGVSYRYVKR